MTSVEDTLLGRRSIRRYERQPVEREKLDLIYAAIDPRVRLSAEEGKEWKW